MHLPVTSTLICLTWLLAPIIDYHNAMQHDFACNSILYRANTAIEWSTDLIWKGCSEEYQGAQFSGQISKALKNVIMSWLYCLLQSTVYYLQCSAQSCRQEKTWHLKSRICSLSATNIASLSYKSFYPFSLKYLINCIQYANILLWNVFVVLVHLRLMYI